MLSSNVKKVCREIDKVMVKGSKEPLNIYTVICQIQNVKEIDDRFTGFEKKERMLQRA